MPGRYESIQTLILKVPSLRHWVSDIEQQALVDLITTVMPHPNAGTASFGGIAHTEGGIEHTENPVDLIQTLSDLVLDPVQASNVPNSGVVLLPHILIFMFHSQKYFVVTVASRVMLKLLLTYPASIAVLETAGDGSLCASTSSIFIRFMNESLKHSVSLLPSFRITLTVIPYHSYRHSVSLLPLFRITLTVTPYPHTHS